MYRASIQMLHSKIDQEELAHKIAEWLQESPQDIFFLRPSTKSASNVLESAQEGGGVRGYEYRKTTQKYVKTLHRTT